VEQIAHPIQMTALSAQLLFNEIKWGPKYINVSINHVHTLCNAISKYIMATSGLRENQAFARWDNNNNFFFFLRLCLCPKDTALKLPMPTAVVQVFIRGSLRV
jgi:hypothetical protein